MSGFGILYSSKGNIFEGKFEFNEKKGYLILYTLNSNECKIELNLNDS